MNPRPVSPPKTQGLDGLRGVAALMVLVFHGFFGALRPLFDPDKYHLSALGQWVATVTHSLSGGVDVFFVLSGYLITRSLLSEQILSRERILNFYARRLARLYPLYLALVAVVAVLGAPFMYLLACALFVANFSDIFGIPERWIPLWSICVEMHFYLLWPLLLKAFGKRGLVVGSIIVILATPFLRILGMREGLDIYSHTWYRFDGLALGSLLAVYLNTRDLSLERTKVALTRFCSVTLFFFIAVLAVKPSLLNQETVAGMIVSHDFWALLSLGIICGVLAENARLDWLKMTWLRKAGIWSYGVFLVHPMLYFLLAMFEKILPTHYDGNLAYVCARAVAVTGVSFIFAKYSFEKFESPMYQWLVGLKLRTAARGTPKTAGAPRAPVVRSAKKDRKSDIG